MSVSCVVWVTAAPGRVFTTMSNSSNPSENCMWVCPYMPPARIFKHMHLDFIGCKNNLLKQTRAENPSFVSVCECAHMQITEKAICKGKKRYSSPYKMP
jgi:hypothetical protein